MTTFGDLLLARAEDDHPALLADGLELSWRQLVGAALARVTVAQDLRGDGPWHVGVMLDGSPDFVLWIAAAALGDFTVVGINTTRRGEELARDVRHTDCQMLVTSSALRPLVEPSIVGIDEERVLCIDEPSYANRVAAAQPATPVSAASTDILMLTFTSGSTGAPKAVVCSTGRLAAIAQRTAPMWGLTRDDVAYQAMPFFHGNAVMANFAPVVGLGATIALRPRFSASGFLPDVRRFGATYFNYVGRSLAYVLATPEQPDDAANPLRLGFGTEASARDRQRFENRFAVRIIEGYGSSEGIISMGLAPGAPAGSIGVPNADGMDVAVHDAETGKECARARFGARGELVNGDEAIGELVNRAGAASFEGYYNNEAAAAERLRGGWYWSGDLAYRDAAGWFYFAGRTADWLRVDSENFSAAPIEAIIARHPAVVMVAVYAVPDARTGDQVMAAIELAPGHGLSPSAFAEFLLAQPDLGTKWAPRFVRLTARMPLTATNKVDKAPLRRDRWVTDDPLWWRPDRELLYEPFGSAELAAWAAQFVERFEP